MTNEELTAIRARCEVATPGPWTKQDADGYCNANPDEQCLSESRTEGERCEGCEYWVWITPGAYIPEILTLDVGEYDAMNNTDAEFIAHARIDVPALLDALEAETALAKNAVADRDYYKRRTETQAINFAETADEYLRWKARAEALERALKHPYCCACYTCRNMANPEIDDNCKECNQRPHKGPMYPNWQFDEARFANSEGVHYARSKRL